MEGFDKPRFLPQKMRWLSGFSQELLKESRSKYFLDTAWMGSQINSELKKKKKKDPYTFSVKTAFWTQLTKQLGERDWINAIELADW